MVTWRDVNWDADRNLPVALTTLVERWNDLERRGAFWRAGAPRALSVEEHVELLALTEAIARRMQVVGARLDWALQAGVSWADAAAAVGQDEMVMRTLYRDWAAGQRDLNAECGGTIGLTAEQYAAAIQRAES